MKRVTNLLQRINKNNRGFSLVELMVAVALIGILTSIIITSANFSETHRNLTMETNRLRAMVRLAQSYSLSIPQQEKENICGFGLYVSDAREYKVYYNWDEDPSAGADCSALQAPDLTLTHMEELETVVINSKKKVEFTNDVNDYVFFTAPYGDVGTSADKTFTLETTGSSGGAREVIVSGEGKID